MAVVPGSRAEPEGTAAGRKVRSAAVRPRLRVDIVTLFPGMFEGPLSESMLKRTLQKGILQVGFTNPRDFATDRHRSVDDRPYGGGAGMVLMAEPVYQALRKLRRRGSFVILLSPQGRPFTQALAEKLAKRKHLILVCGHYEGIDERTAGLMDMELSIGDYVLTGGEIPAMAVTDAVARLLPGVLVKEDAAAQESFSSGLLDYPQYTRPQTWRGRAAPKELLSGDHARIARWRRAAALKATKKKRPDLLKMLKYKSTIKGPCDKE